MSVTWKDTVTSILALLVAGLYYSKMNNMIDLPLISSGYRWSIVLLALVGITMCALSGGTSAGMSNPFIAIASVLGVISFILIVYGLITGAKIAYSLLTMILLVLWLVSTVRHLITR